MPVDMRLLAHWKREQKARACEADFAKWEKVHTISDVYAELLERLERRKEPLRFLQDDR